MIVKIQRPLQTNAVDPLMFINNQDRSHKYHGALTPEVKALMGERFKIYADIKPIDEAGKLEIIEVIQDQPW